MVLTTQERIDVFESCLSVTGEDRHEVIEGWIRDYVLNVIKTDLTNVFYDDVLEDRLNEIFS